MLHLKNFGQKSLLLSLVIIGLYIFIVTCIALDKSHSLIFVFWKNFTELVAFIISGACFIASWELLIVIFRNDKLKN